MAHSDWGHQFRALGAVDWSPYIRQLGVEEVYPYENLYCLGGIAVDVLFGFDGCWTYHT